MTNIRPGGAATVDLAVGNDLFLASSLDAVADAERVPINRSRIYCCPADGRDYMLSTVWSKGSFIPFGAKRADGSPHPHAGTGFGCATEVGYPTDFKVESAELFERWDRYIPARGFENPHSPKSLRENPHPVTFHRVHQYRYDGETFSVEAISDFTFPEDAPYTMHSPGWGLRNGLPDGDDILFPLTGVRSDDGRKVSGVARWTCHDSHWHIADFRPVPGAEDSMEPTIEHGPDGRLYFTCRSLNHVPHRTSIRVWQSADNGRTWTLSIDQAAMRSSSPVTINRTTDGHIFILGNQLDPVKLNREVLVAWPLTPDGAELLPQITVFDSTAEFGLFRDRYDWYVDHPIAEVVQLADGQWHGVIAHRLANRLEVGYDLPPTPWTGTYLSEVVSDGNPLPRWSF